MDSNRKMVLQAWLNTLCQMLPSVQRAAIVCDSDPEVDLTAAVMWPDETIDTTDLSIAIKLSISRNSPVFNIQPQDTQAKDRAEILVAHPIYIPGSLQGTLALLIVASPKQQDIIVQLIKWGQSWLQLILSQQASDLPPLHSSTRLLEICLNSNTARSSAVELANELAAVLDCQRVSVGLVEGKKVRLRGLSNSPHFNPKATLAHNLEAVMEESRTIRSQSIFSKNQSADKSSMIAHWRLAHGEGTDYVCSLPMMSGDEIIGAVVLERNGKPFPPGESAIDPALLGLLGSLLLLKQQTDFDLLKMLKDKRLKFAERLLGTGALKLKLITVGFFALVLLVVLVPGQFRVHSPAVLEGRIQRALVAPFNGFVATASARAGDLVHKDQLIAELDDTDLRLEQQRWLRQRDEQIKQYRSALANLDHTAARIAQSQVAQTDAQLELIGSQLQRAKLVSPLDGIIISGDLSRLLGVPLERGQLLFEVAPLDEYRLILNVDERDIMHVHQGQTGNLTLTAFPQRTIPFTIQRIAALYSQDDISISYRTEAAIEADVADLRPGMQGVGKIDIGERNYLWIWTHKVVDWVRLKMWAWLP